jgi:hypothetical protein
VQGELTLTSVLKDKIIALENGKLRPVTAAERELWLRSLCRHYRSAYFRATPAADE